MDFQDPRFWLDLAQWVLVGLLWLRKPGVQAGEAVAALTNRVAIFEERIKHMPTSEELAELAGSVRALETQAEAQTQQLNTMRVQLTRIEDYLLKNR